MTIEKIRMLALNLSPEERELLGVKLLSTIVPFEDQEGIDAAWNEEILSRSAACRSGTVRTLDTAGTVDRLRQRLATNRGNGHANTK